MKEIDKDAIHAIVEEQVLKAIEKQKAIDIEKACEWLKESNGKRFNGFEIVYTQGFIAAFRKAMEG